MARVRIIILLILAIFGYTVYSGISRHYDEPFYKCWIAYDLAWGKYQMCRMEIEDGKS